jgi:hypothetical protein
MEYGHLRRRAFSRRRASFRPAAASSAWSWSCEVARSEDRKGSRRSSDVPPFRKRCRSSASGSRERALDLFDERGGRRVGNAQRFGTDPPKSRSSGTRPDCTPMAEASNSARGVRIGESGRDDDLRPSEHLVQVAAPTHAAVAGACQRTALADELDPPVRNRAHMRSTSRSCRAGCPATGDEQLRRCRARQRGAGDGGSDSPRRSSAPRPRSCGRTSFPCAPKEAFLRETRELGREDHQIAGPDRLQLGIVSVDL